MVRSSLRIPQLSSIHQLIENMQQNSETSRTVSDKSNRNEPRKSGDFSAPLLIQKKSSSPTSSKDEIKSNPESVLSLDSRSDTESFLKYPVMASLKKDTLSTDSHDDARRRESIHSNSSIGQDPLKISSQFQKPLLYRGSIHLKLQQNFTFNIDEAESEDSRSQKSDRKASSPNHSDSSKQRKKSKNSLNLSDDSNPLPGSPSSKVSLRSIADFEIESPE
jgi:hypothetical protein